MNSQATRLEEIDALVAQRITRERPRILWEDSNAFVRFDSREEAIEALRNPAYCRFVPPAGWETFALREVLIYRPYTTDAAAAWEMIEQFSGRTRRALRVERRNGWWYAAFDGDPISAAQTAPIALCLAALHACGMNVQYDVRRAV